MASWNSGLTKENNESVLRMAEKLKGRVRSLDHSRHISEAKMGKPTWMKGKHHTPEAKEKNRLAHLGNKGWSKGLTKEEHPGIASMAMKQSNLQKRKCKDPRYALQIVSHITVRARDVKPNKPEMQLMAILDKYFPKQWRYAGNGEMTLGRKIPDFVNIDGKKQLIEVFGEYWHRGENPEVRIQEFRQFGFETLVLWESELKDEKSVVAKIQNLKCVEHI